MVEIEAWFKNCENWRLRVEGRIRVVNLGGKGD